MISKLLIQFFLHGHSSHTHSHSHLNSLCPPFSPSFVSLIEGLSFCLSSLFFFFAFCPLSRSPSVCRSQTGFCHRSTICRGRETEKREEAVTEEDRHKESDSLKNKTNLTAERRKWHCREKRSVPEGQTRKIH